MKMILAEDLSHAGFTSVPILTNLIISHCHVISSMVGQKISLQITTDILIRFSRTFLQTLLNFPEFTQHMLVIPWLDNNPLRGPSTLTWELPNGDCKTTLKDKTKIGNVTYYISSESVRDAESE